ncbi:hypothetical protein GJ496_006063 [Pomphorhynchus laevis]|nr:hypothetical protein GJ496_006063 [Pomphorhynchus laevis]
MKERERDIHPKQAEVCEDVLLNHSLPRAKEPHSLAFLELDSDSIVFLLKSVSGHAYSSLVLLDHHMLCYASSGNDQIQNLECSQRIREIAYCIQNNCSWQCDELDLSSNILSLVSISSSAHLELDLSYNCIKNIPNRFLHSKHTISHVRLLGNPITDIPSDFLILSSQLKSITFSGCQMNFKDFLGLDNLKYMDLRGNGIQLISDFVYLLNKSTNYLNIIQNYNPTERQLSDYLDHLIWSISQCLHSTCIPGKQIGRIARKQSIRKIDQHMSSTEFHAKHVFSCVEDMNLYNSNLSIMGYDIYLMFKLRELYLNRNSLREYVRFTCKYYFGYEMDISYNLLEDLFGSDCNDIKRYEIGVNTQLRKLYAFGRWLERRNNTVDLSQLLELNHNLVTAQFYRIELWQMSLPVLLFRSSNFI